MILRGKPSQYKKLGIKSGEPMTEAQIQRAVFDMLESKHIHCWAVPNNPQSRRTVGFKPGCADVHILHKGKSFALELKTEKGKPSEDQLAFISAHNASGGYAFVARGFENAKAILKGWGLI